MRVPFFEMPFLSAFETAAALAFPAHDERNDDTVRTKPAVHETKNALNFRLPKLLPDMVNWFLLGAINTAK